VTRQKGDGGWKWGLFVTRIKNTVYLVVGPLEIALSPSAVCGYC